MVKMGTVWDRTAEFLTDNIGIVLPIALIAYFVPACINGSFAELRSTGSFELQAILTGVALLLSVLSLWGSLAIAAMTLAPDAIDPGAAGRRRLPAALAVAIATLAATFVLALPFGVALAASGVDLQALLAHQPVTIPLATAWFLAIYALVFAGIVLWVSARLVLFTPVIVAERRMFGALGRSWVLTRGLAWRIIGVVVLYAIVAIVAILATRLVFGSIFQLIAGPVEGLSLSGVLTSVTVAAVQTGFTMIAPVFTAKLYLAIEAARPASMR
jgi:hypothetical protein